MHYNYKHTLHLCFIFYLYSLSVKSYWVLWHWGHQTNQTPPYRLLTAYDFDRSTPQVFKAEKALFSKIRKVIQTVDQLSVDNGYVANMDAYKHMTTQQKDELYRQVYEKLLSKFPPRNPQGASRRVGEICIRTVYADVMRYCN